MGKEDVEEYGNVEMHEVFKIPQLHRWTSGCGAHIEGQKIKYQREPGVENEVVHRITP